MKRTIVKALATGAIAFSAFTAGTHFGSLPNPFEHSCKNEGSNNCVWNAKTQGNGKGRSYVVTKSGQLFYFAPKMSNHKSPTYDRDQCVGMKIPNPCVPDSNN